MVQAKGQSQESQASETVNALNEEPDAEEDLLQWSCALDFDDYTRYADAGDQYSTWSGKPGLATSMMLPGNRVLTDDALHIKYLCLGTHCSFHSCTA